MSPKGDSKTTSSLKSSCGYSQSPEESVQPLNISISLYLEGDPPGPGEWLFMILFNNTLIQFEKWQDSLNIECNSIPINLNDPVHQSMVADKPLMFLIRVLGGKGGTKDPDPLLHPDNRAGATLDLLPLVLGEDEIRTRVPIVLISTGQYSGSAIVVHAKVLNGKPMTYKIPMLITLMSAHCLPFLKEGSAGVAAIGLDGIHEPPAINFGLSQSYPFATKLVWASTSNGGFAANTTINIPNDDIFLNDDLIPYKSENCHSLYWNAMKRVLIDPIDLEQKLEEKSFLIELATVPKTGKIEVRGRYMGFFDAKVLLEPGITGVTTTAKLLYYSEGFLPENVRPVLELPPSSAKTSVRDTGIVIDPFGHTAYIILRLDIIDPLVSTVKVSTLFDIMSFSAPDESKGLFVDELHVDPLSDEATIDASYIRNECGALSVHKELSGLAHRGTVAMNQSIKRTAANRLLMRVRSMLKQFPPEACSILEWQEIVSAQHAASRRAVTASFAPQPAPLRLPTQLSATRAIMADDWRIAEKHSETNILALPFHPRTLLLKALHFLEERKDRDAHSCLALAINTQCNNRFLLWAFGAQEFDKGNESYERASVVFRITTRGDYSDGVANTVAWSALHALYHYKHKKHAAFVAAKEMRKAFEIGREWTKFIQRWIESSGVEETVWNPSTLSLENPLLLTSAFFLCLRCYRFSEILMKCVEDGCASRGSRLGSITSLNPDFYYVKAASYLLQKQTDKAMETIQTSMKKFGPSPKMSQMRTSCLMSSKGWCKEVENSFTEMERAGAEPCPSLLLKAAIFGMKTDPEVALQRAARAHKVAPCGHSAYIISQIYDRLREKSLAERWAAAAVKLEPLLADAWALIGIFALRERDIDKARTMLRTARQAGPITPEIQKEVDKLSNFVQAEEMPEALVKGLCLCNYY